MSSLQSHMHVLINFSRPSEDNLIQISLVMQQEHQFDVELLKQADSAPSWMVLVAKSKHGNVANQEVKIRNTIHSSVELLLAKPHASRIHISEDITLNKGETQMYTKLADTVTGTVCRHDSRLIVRSSIWLISVVTTQLTSFVPPVPPIPTRLLTSAIKDPTSSNFFSCPLSC